MSGKNSRMNPLESRKQLLLAESDLNRVGMVGDITSLAWEVHSLANQARTIASIMSAATSLVVGLSTCWRKKSPPLEAKPSWWQTISKGAGLVSSVWSAFRAPIRDSQAK